LKVVQEVRKVRRILRWQAALTGIARVLAIVASALILGLALDTIPGAGQQTHAFFFLLFWIAVPASIVWLVIRPVLRVPSGSSILEFVERSEPYFQNRLSTAYQLAEDPSESERLGYSRDLVRRTLSWAENLQPESAFGVLTRGTDSMKAARIASIPLILLLLIVLTRPREALNIWHGYAVASRWSTASVPAIPPEIRGDRYVPRGEPAELAVAVSPSGEEPHVHYEEAPGRWNGLPTKRVLPGLYTATIPAVERTTRYRASIGSTFSRLETVHPVDPPKLVSVEWRVEPPEYTRLSQVRATGEPGGVEVLAGSVVSATFRANLPLERMGLLEPDGTLRSLDLDEDAFSAGVVLAPTESLDLRLRMLGPLALEATSEAIRVEVVPDDVPRVRIAQPDTVSKIPDSQRVLVLAEARDDYGIHDLELRYEMNYEGREIAVPVLPEATPATDADSFRITVKPEPDAGTPTVAAILIEWDLAALELLPGDEVSFWFVAHDNDTVSGPKEGLSDVHLLRFPSMYEVYESVEAAEEAQVESLEDIIERQRELRENIRDAAEDLHQDAFSPKAGGEKPRWEEEQRLEEAAAEQEEIASELERVAAEVRETAKALNEKTETSLRTLEKMERVRELFDEILTDEMKEIIRQFRRALNEFQQQRGPEPLAELDYSLEQFEQELDSLLELLENTYLERQLEAAVEEMKEVLAAQEEVLERTEEAAADEEATDEERQQEAARLADQEEEIAERAKALAEKLEELGRKMAEKQKKGAEQVQEAARMMEQGELTEDFQEAVEQLSQQNFSGAVPSEQSAKQTMAEASQSMSSAMSMMGGMSFQQDMSALLALIHRSQYLSDRQEQVGDGLESISGAGVWGSPDRKKGLSREQGILSIESRRLRRDFIEFAGESPFRDFSVARLFEDAAHAMSGAAAGTKDQSPSRVRAQSRAALGHVNLATKKLLESYSQACQAQQNLGMNGYFQQLREMIQRQQQLNQDTQRLDGTNRQRPGWQQELERITREQEAIRREMEELQKLREQLQSQEQLLGDLQQIGDEMGEIEKELSDEITDQRVQEKQDRVLTRMLDAERSQREQDLTRERESEVAAGDDMPDVEERDRSGEIRQESTRPGEQLAEDRIPARFRSRIRSYFRRLSSEVF
jgi:hypothetical protein